MSDARLASNDPDASAVAVGDVQLSYPGRRRQPHRVALDGVTMKIPAGQSVALLGPNGSGKSTLIRVLCGLLAPSHGSVAVFGHQHAALRRRAIGVVFQSPALDRHMTVRENLSDQARLHGVRRSEAADVVDEALHAAALSDRRDDLVKTLSLGLSRRVDLCRALLHQPRLVLLDEPTVGLDPAARQSFLALIEKQRVERGLTVLLSTHLMDEADRMDRVILLHRGRIVADGSPQSLRSNLGSRVVTVHSSQWQPPTDTAAHWQQRAGAWTASLDEDPDRACALAYELTEAGLAFSMAPPTLADVFEHCTGERLGRDEAEGDL